MLIECACCKKETEHQHLHNCAHGIPDLEKTHYETTYDRMQRLESQLAEARAEIERLSALTGEWCKTAEMYRRFEPEARKQTAREIVEMLRGAPNGFYIANMIKLRFGLEG